MRRPLVLLALSVAFVVPFALAACAGASSACGGNDKPPLTPDNLEPDDRQPGSRRGAPPRRAAK